VFDRSDAEVAAEVIELMVYEPGAAAPVADTVTALVLELVAVIAWLAARVPSDARLDEKLDTEPCSPARMVFFCSVSESLFCSAVMGIWAI
jgi:hypothetical protein